MNARLFRELERKSAELEVASRHKSEFLASMSHELRTPLNAVIGFSEVLLERMFGDINERQEEYLRDILDSGRHLLELLNEILDLSKVEAGRMELSLTSFPVREALEYGMLMVRERAVSRGVTVTLEVEESVSVVDADEFRFKQVVLNLLSNAVKFTRQRVEVSARSDGTTLTIGVSDDGPGVAPEDRSRIFESFQQGRRGPSKEEGTGLGLTLSRRMVELHGGRISLETDLGVGSTFSFTIPLTASEKRDDAPPAIEPNVSGPAVVVIIEDDPHSLDLLCLYVQRAGVDVVTAGDGGQGLDLIRRIHPAAVVLDIKLPTLDGWDLLALLKGDPATAPIPVVVVSMVDERGKGFALGAAEYLVKPVRGEEVRAALARVASLPESDQTILSIGEDPGVVGLLRAALEPEGWTVLSAINGPEGVEIARSRRPAVVLLDLLLTGQDGMEVVEALRAEPMTAAVPIIALTSQVMTLEDKERLRGQIEYVTRNSEFDASRLLDVVRRAIGHLANSAPGLS
jgi:CheY-like chemotaxis protein/anti-sigma regulatory factor (Ser/Thr protein kinase)